MASKVTKYVCESGTQYTGTGVMLGRGAFGMVMEATDDAGGEVVAIKIKKHPGPLNQFEKQEQDILVRLASKGGNENVFKLLDFAVQVDDPAKVRNLVTERLDCSLMTWQNVVGRSSSFALAAPAIVKVEMARQIFSGLAFVHDNRIVHQDLQCGNILIDKRNGLVKLCDFGNSIYMDGASSQFAMIDPNLKRLEDLRRCAGDIVAFWWLNNYYHTNRARALEVFGGGPKEKAVDWTFRSSNCTIMFKHNRGWWATADPTLKENILHVTRWGMETPSHKGLPVPGNVIDVLSVCLYFAPYDQLTARNIRDKFAQIISLNERTTARDFIRQAATS